MAADLQVTAVQQGTATAIITSDGSSPAVEVQVSLRDDFSFEPAPIYSYSRAALNGSGNAVTIHGLGAGGEYHTRAREVLTNNARGPWSAVRRFQTLTAAAAPPFAGVMVDPAMIVIPKKFDVLPFNSSPQLVGYPMSNLLVDGPCFAGFESTGKTSGQETFIIDLDIGFAGEFDTIAILNSNASADGIWQVMAWEGAVNSQLVTPHGMQAQASLRAGGMLRARPGYHALRRSPSPIRARTVRIYAYAAAPVLYVQQIVIGKALVTKNMAGDKREQAVQLGQSERRAAGFIDRTPGMTMRRVDFELSALTERQYEETYAPLLMRPQGPILAVPNMRDTPYLHDRILYGDLMGGSVANPVGPRFTRSFTVESMI